MMNLDGEGLSVRDPYLAPSADIAAAWTGHLDHGADAGPRVGVVWGGNPSHKNDQNRSIPLADFARLFAHNGVRFFSLQVGRADDDLSSYANVTDLQDRLTDFAQTAGALANLDLVISVDTSVAHLAGAMGRPVWTLLPYVPDWRWGLEGETTLWYPSMRLFRQGADRAWGPVLDAVAGALSAL